MATKTPKLYGPKVIDLLVPRYFRTQTDLQAATGLAYSTVNDWKNGKADPRPDALEKVVAALRERHGIETNPHAIMSGELEPPREITLERPERYPNRVVAIEFARKAGIPEEAIARVAGMALHSDSDPNPLEWLEDIRVEARRLRRDAVDPAAATAERARSDARVSSEEADAERLRAERLAALSAKRKKTED